MCGLYALFDEAEATRSEHRERARIRNDELCHQANSHRLSLSFVTERTNKFNSNKVMWSYL